MPVYIHLRIHVPAARHEEFKAFLRRATPYYESPGGIKMHLLQADEDPESFIELVEYATEEGYAKDQVWIEEDPQMRALLAEWRTLLSGPPKVEIWRSVDVS